MWASPRIVKIRHNAVFPIICKVIFVLGLFQQVFSTKLNYHYYYVLPNACKESNTEEDLLDYPKCTM